MKLSISLGFDVETTEKIMKVSNELKKCSRKGHFRKQKEYKMHILVMDDVKNILPVLKVVEFLKEKPFTINIKALDRSRRDGGDIYWVLAEDNDILTELNKKAKELADEKGYEYSGKPFKPRVELGNMIIARPKFEVEPFEAKVCSVSVIKHIEMRDKVNYEVFYKRELI